MIWLPQHKVLYLNAPKAGSVTICNALHDYCYLNGISYKRHADYGIVGSSDWEEHPNRRAMENKLNSLGISLGDAFVFTTIRNPWLRVKSHFKFARYDANGRPWWDPAYDPESGHLSQSDWLYGSSKGWSWHRSKSKFEEWSRYYRCSSYARPVSLFNSTQVFKIEDELDTLVSVLDERLPKFSDLWKSRPNNHENVGDYMFTEKNGAPPKQKLEFTFDKKIVSKIARLWSSDIKRGKYRLPNNLISG